jgi:hypothetical protein
VLHRERLHQGRAYAKWLHQLPDAELPEGSMIAVGDRAFAVSPEGLRPWSFEGFGAPVDGLPLVDALLITPPSIVAVLGAGYRPTWRLSAVAHAGG